MTLEVIMRALVIAFLAAVAAWLSAALILRFPAVDFYALMFFGFAFLGSFAIGLPIALLVFWLAGRELAETPAIVFSFANLAGVMMMLASFVLADASGMLMLGVPSWIAANVYALLGWFWILKPGRAANENEGELGQ